MKVKHILLKDKLLFLDVFSFPYYDFDLFVKKIYPPKNHPPFFPVCFFELTKHN